MDRFLAAFNYDLSFTKQKAVLFLNNAQRRSVTLIRRHFRHELDNDFIEVPLGENGSVDLSNLEPLLFGTYIGIDNIRLTDGKFCTKKSFEEIRQIRNRSIIATTSRPIYYHRGNKIYVEPYTEHDSYSTLWVPDGGRMVLNPLGADGTVWERDGERVMLADSPVTNDLWTLDGDRVYLNVLVDKVDIYGYRRPVDMVLDSVDCELSEGLQDVIIEIATSLWLDSIGEREHAEKCRLRYLERIAEIHSTMAPTDSVRHDSDIEESWNPMDDEPRIEYWGR